MIQPNHALAYAHKGKCHTVFGPMGKGLARVGIGLDVVDCTDPAQVPASIRDVYAGDDAIHVFYGATPEIKHLWFEAQDMDRGVYVDNGYFGSSWYGGTAYKVTWNRIQPDGRIEPDEEHLVRRGMDRLVDNGVEIEPVRAVGPDAPVLVTLQSRPFYETFRGMVRDQWLERVMAAMPVLARPVHVRDKTSDIIKGVPFDRYIRDHETYAVVSFTSNTVVEALVAGVPAVSATGPCAAEAMSTPVGRLGSPTVPTQKARRMWAAGLAARQWTLEQMESAQFWNEFVDQFRRREDWAWDGRPAS